MSIEELQRRNKVVTSIRQLERKCCTDTDNSDESELVELQIEANENNWLYW